MKHRQIEISICRVLKVVRVDYKNIFPSIYCGWNLIRADDSYNNQSFWDVCSKHLSGSLCYHDPVRIFQNPSTSQILCIQRGQEERQSHLSFSLEHENGNIHRIDFLFLAFFIILCKLYKTLPYYFCVKQLELSSFNSNANKKTPPFYKSSDKGLGKEVDSSLIWAVS